MSVRHPVRGGSCDSGSQLFRIGSPGGLFLAGLALIQGLCVRPVLASFRWQELAVLVIWGQCSELAVEIVSVLNDGWVYSAAHSWNPVLFYVAGHPITIIPQLIWLAAPIAYYLCALRLIRNSVIKA